MERRVSKRVKSLLSAPMDPKLWDNLPSEVLAMIYHWLPIRDFYNLRAVCKEWTKVASEQRCASDLVRKPCFLSFQQGHVPSATGTLAFNVKSGSWIWRFQRFPEPSVTYGYVGYLSEPFVVEGILFEATAVAARFTSPTSPILHVGVPQDLLFDVQVDKDFSDFKRWV